VDERLVRLVERRDVAGISSVLSELLADAPQRARLGEAGRIYTRNLSWSAVAERHEQVYRATLKRGTKASAAV
jgi:glycosyltransferase involved in cell wall biosynthesis